MQRSSGINIKEVAWTSFILMIFLLIPFWEIFTLKLGFISGDHKVQHYPWLHYMATELKAGRLPLWTGLIGCGFPLFAEGQIGLYYPFNLLFFSLIPSFKFAYNYSTLFHFWLGGLFFYLFCRKLSISSVGAFISTYIYLFGSIRGGYFYNANSQKTVIWFPLALYLIEKLIETRSWIFSLWIGVIFGMQFNAGYIQIAFYCVVFSLFYYFLRSVFGSQNFKDFIERMKPFLLHVVIMGVAGLLVSLPQFLATWELSQFSSRGDLPESFAYIGSKPPWGIVTLLFPFLKPLVKGMLFGADFYVGLFSLFLIFVAWSKRREIGTHFWVLFWLGILALLIALGMYSPLYVAIVKITQFYGFRVPSKTLYFLSFTLLTLRRGLKSVNRSGSAKLTEMEFKFPPSPSK